MTNASTAQCPVCRQDAPFLYDAWDVNRSITDERFPYYRCGHCRTVFLSPLPPDLGRYYGEDYYPVPATLEELDRAALPDAYKVDVLASLTPAPGKRLLEIGPAAGYFARQAQRAGYQVHVVEMSAECCGFLREKVGIEVTHSAKISGALEAGRQYDVIALWQVVEHLPNPMDELAALAKHLAPNGVLVVAAPNPDSIQARALGRYWWHLDAPRHVTLIPPGTLVEHVRALGLRPELVTATDPGSLEWNRLGWHFSFLNRFRMRFLRSVAKRAAALVAWLMQPFEQRGLRGSTYTVAWRKP